MKHDKSFQSKLWQSRNNFMAQNKSITNLYKTLIDLGYCLFFCPFRLKYNPTDDKYAAVSSLVHKFICGVIYFLLSIWLLGFVRSHIPNQPKSPTQVINFLMCIGPSFTKLSLLNIFWQHQDDITSIINHIMTTRINLKCSKMASILTNKISVLLISATIVLLSTTFWITGITLETKDDHISTWSISWWLHRHLATSRFTYFMEQEIEQSRYNVTLNLTTENTIIVVLGKIGHFYRHLVGCYTDVFLLCVTLMLWLGAKGFSDLLDWENDRTAIKIHFLEVQVLSSRLDLSFCGYLWTTCFTF